MNTTTPAAEARNHNIALDAAKAHFGSRKPSYAEAHKYADMIGFAAAAAARKAGNYNSEARAAQDACYYARAAALSLCN